MIKLKIANNILNNRYILAPMAGYTDLAYRLLCYKYKPALLYTEMISSEALIYNSKETLKEIKDTYIDKETCKDSLLALQLFSGKKESVLNSIKIVEENADYDFLDFNCGCPVTKVIKQHAGSFWLNREDELIDLLKDMVKISKKPVSVKIRIGYTNYNDIVPLCKKIEDTGVSFIAVHGRLRSEFFSGQVHYDVIKDIKKNLSIPVIANGSIDIDNASEILNYTKADGIMIGQNALGYPKIFKDLIDLENKRKITQTTLKDQIEDLKMHINLIFKYKDPLHAASIMRGFSLKYFKGFNNAKQYKNELVKANTKEEYLSILDKIEC